MSNSDPPAYSDLELVGLSEPKTVIPTISQPIQPPRANPSTIPPRANPATPSKPSFCSKLKKKAKNKKRIFCSRSKHLSKNEADERNCFRLLALGCLLALILPLIFYILTPSLV